MFHHDTKFILGKYNALRTSWIPNVRCRKPQQLAPASWTRRGNQLRAGEATLLILPLDVYERWNSPKIREFEKSLIVKTTALSRIYLKSAFFCKTF
jgi:hypothetical protein